MAGISRRERKHRIARGGFAALLLLGAGAALAGEADPEPRQALAVDPASLSAEPLPFGVHFRAAHGESE